MCERWVGDWTNCNILTPSSFAFSSTFFSFYWVAPVYIIVCRPPASCERRICTQFNPSPVKVIPWYLRPVHLFLDWRLGRRSIRYTTQLPKMLTHPAIALIALYLRSWLAGPHFLSSNPPLWSFSPYWPLPSLIPDWIILFILLF